MDQPRPNQKGVLVVTSRSAGQYRRVFTIEASDDLVVPDLPSDLEQEKDLVELMGKRGLRLTMVGGGSRSDETRRFYFRRR